MVTRSLDMKIYQDNLITKLVTFSCSEFQEKVCSYIVPWNVQHLFQETQRSQCLTSFKITRYKTEQAESWGTDFAFLLLRYQERCGLTFLLPARSPSVWLHLYFEIEQDSASNFHELSVSTT